MKDDRRSRIGRWHPSRLLITTGLALGILASAAFNAPVTTAAATPTLEPLRITPGGLVAMVEVRASEEVSLTYSLTQAGAGRVLTEGLRPLDGVRAPVGTGGGTADPGREPVFSATSQFKLTGLKSNTTYTIAVRATNRAGQQASAQATFATLKQRVRIQLDSIVIHDDGDAIGRGEPTWFWRVETPFSVSDDCFPFSAGHCKEGKFGETTVIPTTGSGQLFQLVFAEENFQPTVDPTPQPGSEDFSSMPQVFVIRANAVESDLPVLTALDHLLNTGAFVEGAQEVSWQAPQNVESARDFRTIGVSANNATFRSTMRFRFELFYSNESFPPNDGRVHSTSK